MDTKSEEKIFTSPLLLAKKLNEFQIRGKKIIFTNGCFDLIHTGHTRYLRAARLAGDVLVIAVNSDKSVQGLKGPTRPVVSLKERMEILSGFYFVDFVCFFEENTPLELIKILKPDILVKGGDWDLERIVGKDFVESKGGSVFTVPEIKGNSTSNIINRIINSKEVKNYV